MKHALTLWIFFAMAVGVGVGQFAPSSAGFDLTSGEAFVGVVVPLIEVPAFIWLANVAFWMRKRYFTSETKNSLLSTGIFQAENSTGSSGFDFPATYRNREINDC